MEAIAADLSAFPEDCIVQILSWTSPPAVCRLSLVSRSFKSAAYSDAVWETFFPPDYQDILSRSSSSSSLHFSSKRELFFYLCDHPVLIDNGKMSFSLDRADGLKCYMLAPRDKVSINNNRFCEWCWNTYSNSRFQKAFEILQIWSLAIQGKISTSLLSADTNYAAYLVFKMAERTFGGFSELPIEVSVERTGDEDKETENVCLDPFHGALGLRGPEQREDGWFEIELGEYFIVEGDDYELEMELMEVKDCGPKGGLVVQGIEVRPKRYRFGKYRWRD